MKVLKGIQDLMYSNVHSSLSYLLVHFCYIHHGKWRQEKIRNVTHVIAEVMSSWAEKAVFETPCHTRENCQIEHLTLVLQRRNSGTKIPGTCKVIESNEASLYALLCAHKNLKRNRMDNVRSLEETKTLLTD